MFRGIELRAKNITTLVMNGFGQVTHFYGHFHDFGFENHVYRFARIGLQCIIMLLGRTRTYSSDK